MSKDENREHLEDNTSHNRPTWDEYFLGIMEKVGARSTCDRGRSGAVIVQNKRIVSTGYVGAPSGVDHCDDVGHEMHEVTKENGETSRHCIRTSHAEQNAIAQAARVGAEIKGSTLYSYMTPCYTCAKIIINAGIERVVAKKDYHAGSRSKEVFDEAGIRFDLIEEKIEEYDKQ